MDLAQEERDAIRDIADGKLETVPLRIVIALVRCKLLTFNGESIVLTREGWAVSQSC
jgi:hypothetical protein